MQPPDPLEPLVLIEDEPVGVVEADRLELLPFAQVVAGTALGTTGPFTIGVYADWGQGKTSVLRLAHRLLEVNSERGAAKNVVPVWFNAWQYEREEHPIVPLLAIIVRSLEERNAQVRSTSPASNLSSGLATLARALRAIAYGFSAKAKVKIPGFAELESGFVAREMIQRYEQLASSPDPLLERSLYYRAFDLLEGVTRKIDESEGQIDDNPKIVVFIDDLDRCLPPQSLKLLESLKLVLSQPGFIFALAVDRRVLIEYLRHRFRADLGADLFDGLGVYYLDKLVQLPLPLPPHERRFGLYIKRVLQEAPALQVEANRPVQEALQELIPVLAVGSNYNPRTLVRFINNLIVDRRLWTAINKDRRIDANLLGLCAVSRILQQHLEDYQLYRFLVRNQDICTALAAGGVKIAREEFGPKADSEWPANPMILKLLLRLEASDFLRQLLQHEVARQWLTTQDARLEVDDFLYRAREAGAPDLSGEQVFQNAVREALGSAEITSQALGDLDTLDLSYSKMTDEALSGLVRVPKLSYLNLSSSSVTDAGLAQLKFLRGLKRLDLTSCPITDTGMPHLRFLTELESLRLFSTRIGDIGLRQISALANLRRLSLWSTRITDAGLALLTGLRFLEDLDIGDTGVTDSGLVALREFPKLEWLVIDRTAASDSGLQVIGDLRTLIHLDLSQTKISDNGLKELAGLRNLKTLIVSGTTVTGRGFDSLKDLESLSRLDLSHTEVVDETSVALLGLENLCELDLSFTRITDRGLKRLVSALQFKRLDLRGTQISDEGVAILGGVHSLERLDLADTQLTPVGLGALSHLQSLRVLHLSSALRNEPGIQDFLRLCPGCDIEYVGTEMTTPSSEGSFTAEDSQDTETSS